MHKCRRAKQVYKLLLRTCNSSSQNPNTYTVFSDVSTLDRVSRLSNLLVVMVERHLGQILNVRQVSSTAISL